MEVGANDGIRQSNTLFLERVYGASGLLIEASPSLFERCIHNRGPKNIFEHCALVPQDYTEEYMELIYSDLMTISTHVCDRDPKTHAERGKRFIKSKNYSFLSPAKTLSHLLNIHNIRNVDILSIDLEGYEIEALRGSRLENRIIKNILVENRDLSGLRRFMEANDYRYIQSLSHHDHLFSLK